MSQDQRPGQIKMVDGQAGAPGDVIVEETGAKPPAATGKGGGMLPLLLFAVGAAAAGAAVARLGVGT